MENPSERGLRLSLIPDRSLFPEQVQVGFHRCCGMVQQLAMFHPSTKFIVIDEPNATQRDYQYPRGLKDYMEELGHGGAKHLAFAEGNMKAEAWVVGTSGRRTHIMLFCNGAKAYGGTPLRGLSRGLLAIRRARPGIRPWRLRAQLIVLSRNLPNPDWRGATQDIVGNLEVGEMVRRMVEEQWPI